jgi:hypothetical protein
MSCDWDGRGKFINVGFDSEEVESGNSVRSHSQLRLIGIWEEERSRLWNWGDKGFNGRINERKGRWRLILIKNGKKRMNMKDKKFNEVSITDRVRKGRRREEWKDKMGREIEYWKDFMRKKWPDSKRR